jgi:hypothetical protein
MGEIVVAARSHQAEEGPKVAIISSCCRPCCRSRCGDGFMEKLSRAVDKRLLPWWLAD